MEQIKKDKKIYHAAIYVRLSKEDGDVDSTNKRESNSISNQKDLIKYFLKDKEDIVIVSERVDDGYTGSNFNRPAFQMMMEDIKNGIVDCVVVKDLSRFGREYIDAGRYIERIFPSLGVRFIAINDNYDSIENRSQVDEIMIPFKNLINDAYCRDISVKIRSHLEVKRKNGEYIGAFTPYGYKKDEADKHKLVVDTYAASIVKEIFRMKLSGMNQTAIANLLNAQGVLSPMEYKHSIGINIQDNFKKHEQAEWSAMSVRRILENEVYIGTLIQGKRSTPNHKLKVMRLRPSDEWIKIENSHEAVVTKREFAIVQRLLGLDTRTSPNEETVYPLSGLVVCGDCGALMVKRDVPAGGKVYSYYICSQNAQTKACSTHRIPKAKLEEVVLEVLKVHIENILDIKRIIEYIGVVPFQELDIKALQKRKDAMEDEAERCEGLRNFLYEDFKEGIITKQDYAELRGGYTEKIKKAEQAIRNIELQIQEIIEEKSEKYKWLGYFTEHQNIKELTRTVAVELIEQIKIYDKKTIEVVFTFDDCYRLVLEQMKELGCTVTESTNGRVYIEGREVAKDGKKIKEN
jgi:DNA invertase Pin-like site-specific DNA recombinase